jgi:hypothetical protein
MKKMRGKADAALARKIFEDLLQYSHTRDCYISRKGAKAQRKPKN